MTEGSPIVEAPARTHHLYWWKEGLIVVAFYVVYSWIRNRFGSNIIAEDGVPEAAFHNAERVIQLERLVGLFHEESLQELFLSKRMFIQFWNVYYGTAHFFVTLAVFILLFFKRSDVFPQWRNTLAAMTALAILGFAFFPLMPPRLLDQPCPAIETFEFGGACVDSALRPGKDQQFTGDNGFGFVDTLSVYGGPWRFDSEEVASISNQYAAMPSLHVGWSTWCAFAVWPLIRRRWAKALVLLYPLATTFCIIVTANHFWLDGIGGLAVFAVGALIGWGMHRWNQNRLDRAHMLNALISERSGVPREPFKLRTVATEIRDDVAREMPDHDASRSVDLRPNETDREHRG
jgi:PAP2 superfamily